jgi:IS5 family transposase
MQTSFSELEYASKKKLTRRDRFLTQIEAVTPWAILEQTITPFYPSSGGRGRPPIGLSRMLRMYIAQQCFGLSDEGIEDALYDSQAIRRFVGIDLGRDSAPDATTLLGFRHLLESHQLTESVFNAINGHLAEKGLFLREGTIVDATLIAAPPSTKNEAGKRDPEMHQSKKGNQWYFGMTSRRRRTPAGRSREAGCGHERSEATQVAHIGVDAHSGLVHTVIGTAGNISDISQAQALLHGEEKAAFGDAGYQGVEKRSESAGANVTWHVAEKPSKVKQLAGTALGDLVVQVEYAKARIRAKVEHPFHVVKNLFRHRKTRYKGLAKNTAQCFTLFGLANLVLARRWLLAADGKVAS